MKFTLIILFVLTFFGSYSQVNINPKYLKKDKPVKSCILSCKPETHSINNDLIHRQIQQNKSSMLTMSPLKMIKFTVTAGFNNKIISQTGCSPVDAFNEIDVQNALTIVKYDARLKIYLNKRWRFLVRAQSLGFGKDVYSMGFFWKV
jgi:hypothetical protein